MISMVEFDGLPEEQQDELQRKLATLRDGIPPVPFARSGEADAQGARRAARARVLGLRRACVRRGLDRSGPSRDDGRRRRRGREGPVSRGGGGGRDRPAQRDAAAAARQAAGPGPGREGAGRGDARADRRGARLRARGPEPAPHRAAACEDIRSSACRASTRTFRPGACWCPSTSRESASRRSAEPTRRERDRYGEIVFRFFFGLLYRDRIALGDPHPGNYLLCPDGTGVLSRLRPASRRRRRAAWPPSGRSRSPSATGDGRRSEGRTASRAAICRPIGRTRSTPSSR